MKSLSTYPHQKQVDDKCSTEAGREDEDAKRWKQEAPAKAFPTSDVDSSHGVGMEYKEEEPQATSDESMSLYIKSGSVGADEAPKTTRTEARMSYYSTYGNWIAFL